MPFIKQLSAAIFCVSLFLGLGQPVLAQLTEPIDHDTEIRAVVPSRQPPPAPILRRPSNGSVMSDGKIEFRWEQVTGHLLPLDRYEISLNGELLYELPLTDEETDDYVYWLEDGMYHLRLKSPARLEDGEYTWKVRVIDINDKGTNSATWKFTVDSSAPPIIVTNIQGQEMSISATDPQTIPTSPVVVNVSQPFIYGSTESSAEIQLQVTRASGEVQQFKMTATSDGHFLFTLSALNENEIVDLTFIAIDAAGNTRALSGLQIQYVPYRPVITLPGLPGGPPIVIPLPTIPGVLLPQPTPPSLRPTPSASPQPVQPGQPEQPLPTQPGQQVFERPVVQMLLWRLILALLLLGYVLSLFIWTGNALGVFIGWLGRLLWWWLLVPEGNDRAATPTGKGVPWLPMQVEWLESEGKLRRRHIWTSPRGYFHLPQQFSAVETLLPTSARWQWRTIPTDRIVPAGYVGVTSLTLARPSAPVPDCTLVAADQYIWAWFLPVPPSQWRAQWSWVPRIFVALWVILATWLVWNAPVLESFLWLALGVYFLLRDVQARLPRRWEAWGETEPRQG